VQQADRIQKLNRDPETAADLHCALSHIPEFLSDNAGDHIG